VQAGREAGQVARGTHTHGEFSLQRKKRRQARAPKKVERRLLRLKERERKLSARARTTAEKMEVVESRERAADARERALTERDGLANERDRRAAERDALANERDRRAAERDASWPAARPAEPYVGGERRAHVVTDDEEDPALERARLEAQLQRAHLDGLTGAYRREAGRLALRNEIERARRSDGRFVVAFVDVDGLKGVNDREGHAAGDKVLRTLAATMRANLRSYDPIVRYGGDEFVCGVAAIDPSEVQHRIGVIDQSLRHSTGVGITAGLASMVDHETLEELTERADAALLDAKRSRPN
jgi:diguanylate cyclase (GGDEF)-like protein